MEKPTRLTKNRAQMLMQKVFGIKNAKLERDAQVPLPHVIYRGSLGELDIVLRNVCQHGRSLYELLVSTESAGAVWMYFDPATLEHDYQAEDAVRREIRREICNGCPKA